jgi:hypothetical protein
MKDKPETVTTCAPGYGWQVGDVITPSGGPAMRVSRIVSATELELEPASWWRRALRRVLRFIDTAAQAFGLACLPFVLLAGITIWLWFPLLCLFCGIMAARAAE